MPLKDHLLASLTWKTVRKQKYEVAILPWGATEPHNYHLPFGTDIIESEYIASESARRACERGAKVIVLPTIPFGVNTGQLDLNMTVNMNPSTQAMVLRDVVESLVGVKKPKGKFKVQTSPLVKKLVILNSHGGNDFRQMIRELQPQYPEIFLCTVNWWQILDQKKFFENPDDHAGEMETSIMLAIAPELVLPLSEAGSGKTKSFRIKALRERWAWAPRQWTKASEDTGAGDPSKATAEKGKSYLDALTTEIAGFLIELAKANVKDLYKEL